MFGISACSYYQVIGLMRASVAEVMSQNYIRAARIKGLSNREIVTQHVLRNAIPPIVPKVGVQLSSMITLAIITESIFNWPGIGRWLLDALSNEPKLHPCCTNQRFIQPRDRDTTRAT